MKYLIKKKDAYKQPLYVRIHKRNPNVDMTLNTGLVVDTAAWVKANKSVREWEKFKNSSDGRDVAKKIDLIDGILMNMEITSYADRETIQAAIAEVVSNEAIKLQKEIQEAQQQEKFREMAQILNYAEAFYLDLQEGRRRANGRVASERWLQNIRATIDHIKQSCPKDVTFDDVDKKFVNKFIAYFEKRNYLRRSINKYLAIFGMLCKAAVTDGVTNNLKCMNVWQKLRIEKDDTQTEIYLTDEELDAIYNYPLKGFSEMVRDVFVMGCILCQRHSDYSAISKDNIMVVSDDLWIVSVLQKKTRTYVEIPVTDQRFFDICHRHNFTFNQHNTSTINQLVKRVAFAVSKDVPTLMDEYETVMTINDRRKEETFKRIEAKRTREDWEERLYKQYLSYQALHGGDTLFKRSANGKIIKYKWELVASHTARRSGITNLYKSGLLDTREIMSISGHKTEQIFENYIKVGIRENALRIADKLLAAKKK